MTFFYLQLYQPFLQRRLPLEKALLFRGIIVNNPVKIGRWLLKKFLSALQADGFQVCQKKALRQIEI
jgi:hypothetical protein